MPVFRTLFLYSSEQSSGSSKADCDRRNNGIELDSDSIYYSISKWWGKNPITGNFVICLELFLLRFATGKMEAIFCPEIINWQSSHYWLNSRSWWNFMAQSLYLEFAIVSISDRKRLRLISSYVEAKKKEVKTERNTELTRGAYQKYLNSSDSFERFRKFQWTNRENPRLIENSAHLGRLRVWKLCFPSRLKTSSVSQMFRFNEEHFSRL